jgi:hypothetical protein
VDDFPSLALPAVPESVFQSFPVELVFSHFLEGMAGKYDLAPTRLTQPEQLA